ncbi:MAG: sigma-54-dependent transcriptional regulator [Thermodesulfobacteriota bacterium]
MFKVLVVDDDEELVIAVQELLEKNNYKVLTAFSGEEAIELYQNSPDVSIALVDLVMPMMDGFTLIDKLKEINKQIDIFIITGQGTIQTAVEAIKKGAKDFIIKPYDKDLLLNKLASIRKTYELENKVSKLKEIISEKYGFENIITRSPIMNNVFEKATAASKSSANVFIIGETGTGKGLIAKAIHIKSNRKDLPFVSINCGSIPKELLESELFGHKKGSFTGAINDHTGLFVSARGGTIFLDEIGEMPKDLQVRILHVLEDHKVRPIGETKEIEVHARVIAATNRSIDDLKNIYLREDLFYRLAVIVIELPTLRERKQDIQLLVQSFIKKFNEKYSQNIINLTNEALDYLISYEFPGNIRELENLLEGIIAISSERKTTINVRDITSHLLWNDKTESGHAVLKLDKIEKQTLQKALRESQGNKSKAAKMLGISRDTLYRKLKEYETN